MPGLSALVAFAEAHPGVDQVSFPRSRVGHLDVNTDNAFWS
jgi:hypothetical protein